ncbi:MAG: hypothetical protein RIM72_09375 [Alphaproteobacteria bacterium]
MAQNAFEPDQLSPIDAYAAALRWYRGFQEFLIDNTGDYGPFAKMLGGSDALALDVDAMLRVHDKAMQLLHGSLNMQLRALFIGAVDRYAAQKVSPTAYRTAADDTVRMLDERGFVQLSSVEPHRIESLLDWFNANGLIPPETITNNPQSAEPEPADVLRLNGNIGQVPRQTLLRAPGLISLATDPDAFAVARGHLGAPPILIDVSAWRSFAGEDGAKEAKSAQHFHFDQDDYRFCKMFVYLTDVDEDGGPHIFVPTTHRPETIAAHRPPEGSQDRAAFDDWYYRTLRKSERDVSRWLGIEPVAITGTAGSRFIVNTEGIHRGAPPVTHDRWVLQCVYGVTPYTFWKGPYNAPHADGLDPAAAYAAQLLFAG